jgi:putative zinc finger/helix-turn-helix YgiT family protein
VFCPNCYCENNVEIREESEIIVVRGDEIKTTSKITYCKNCGEKIWNNEIDNDNLLKAYELYRKKHGLLTSNEIKAIREQYNISQITFSKILGLGEKTITRYENGSIQDVAQNNLILLAENVNNFVTLFEKQKHLLKQDEVEKIEQLLEEKKVKVMKSNKYVAPKLDADIFYGGFTYEQRKQQYEFNPAI